MPFAEVDWSLWRESLVKASGGALSEQPWRELQLALDTQRSKYHWSQSESRQHQLLRGVYHGGWLGLLTRWTRSTPQFLIVLDKHTRMAELRIIP